MNVIEFTGGRTAVTDEASERLHRRQEAATDHHAHTVGMAMVVRYMMRNQERYKAERTYGLALATAQARLCAR